MKTRTYLLLMLAAILVPVACLSFFALHMLLESERESRIRSIQEIANSTSLLIDSEIAMAEASIRNVANSEGIRRDDFAGLHQLLTATRTSALSWTLIADYPGNGLMNTLVPYGTPLATRSGDWAARIYDRQASEVSGYFKGTLSKRGVVSVSVPVPAWAGKKYVVTRIFDPNYFNKVFRRNQVQPGWIIGVFDSNGVTIARNRNADSFAGARGRPELVEASHHARSGVVRHPTREGIEVYDIFVRSERTNWTVAIGVPVTEIESPARLTTLYAALALLGVLGAAVAIAVFFGRRIDKSLREATSAAHALAAGKVAPPSRSRLKEVSVLLEVLHRTGLAFSRESAARLDLEQERENLLLSERRARQLAEAQNEAKDKFISMLSHELRNPMAAISGAISVIRLPGMAPARVEWAWQIVVRQLEHLTALMRDLLDERRVMAGKVTLHKAPVNVGDIVRFCCDSLTVTQDDRHAWTIETADAWTLGDATRLEQVIDNLLANSIKYTPEGGSIRIRNYLDQDTVVIEVSDTGVGMSAHVLPTIFDSLVQGPTTIDRSQGGLGLGLSIAHGLVEMHGGTITAHSDGEGMGSTFVVRLPAVPRELDTATAQSEAPATGI